MLGHAKRLKLYRPKARPRFGRSGRPAGDDCEAIRREANKTSASWVALAQYFVITPQLVVWSSLAGGVLSEIVGAFLGFFPGLLNSQQ